MQIGVVALLARYPVKSMGGEELAEVEIGARGLAGDRQWAVYTDDGGIGSGKTTRRFRRVDGLLEWRARLEGEVPVVESPTGSGTARTTPARAFERRWTGRSRSVPRGRSRTTTSRRCTC